jgi:hypothetical protein
MQKRLLVLFAYMQKLFKNSDLMISITRQKQKHETIRGTEANDNKQGCFMWTVT